MKLCVQFEEDKIITLQASDICPLKRVNEQCCCDCIYLLPVHYHCCTEPKPLGGQGCVCNIQKGWACVAPNHNRVYDNWPRHSCGCELHTLNNKTKF